MAPATPKTILITGCSADGIGAAIALLLARRGHHVIATARNPAKIPPALSSLDNVTIHTLDVASPTSIEAAARAVREAGRGLDVLVNNAGVEYVRPVLDIDVAEAQRLFDTNFWGPLHIIQAFSNLLIASRGRIVNISSSATVINPPWMSAYSASKAALNAVSETLRLELEPLGVSVVTILPGVIHSKLHTHEVANLELPSTSRYVAIKDIIACWARGEVQPQNGTSVEKFAELVEKDILGTGKASGGLQSRGAYAAMMRRIGQYSPVAIADYIFSQNQGLEELRKSLNQEKKS